MTDYGRGYSIMPTEAKIEILMLLGDLEFVFDKDTCPECGCKKASDHKDGGHGEGCRIKRALRVLRAGISGDKK